MFFLKIDNFKSQTAIVKAFRTWLCSSASMASSTYLFYYFLQWRDMKYWFRVFFEIQHHGSLTNFIGFPWTKLHCSNDEHPIVCFKVIGTLIFNSLRIRKLKGCVLFRCIVKRRKKHKRTFPCVFFLAPSPSHPTTSNKK
jgi:hypothetical protein